MFAHNQTNLTKAIVKRGIAEPEPGTAQLQLVLIYPNTHQPNMSNGWLAGKIGTYFQQVSFYWDWNF